MLRTRIGLFLVVGLWSGGIVGGNMLAGVPAAAAVRPMSRRAAGAGPLPDGLSPRIGLWIVLSRWSRALRRAVGAGHWQTWLLFLNGGPFGVKDPQFDMDVAFYVFDCPF